MERETGVEPATSTLARSRSTTELLPLDVSFYSTCAFTDNSRHTYWYALMAWVRQSLLQNCGEVSLRLPPEQSRNQLVSLAWPRMLD